MEKVLINSDKYHGQYVAIISIEDATVVGSGDTPEKALREAREKGVQNPYILFIPKKNLVHIYYAG